MSASSPIFFKSVFNLKDLPSEGIPEIVLIGRSNVGKSSLINSLAGRKDLAKTSSKPGKTQSLNFYRFPQEYFLVDSPGYGFAHRSYEDQKKWRQLMETYISERKELRAIGIVIDARHPELESDVLAMEWLVSLEKPWMAILSKADKMKQGALSAHEKYIKTEFSGYQNVFSVSALKGTSIGTLRAYIGTLR